MTKEKMTIVQNRAYVKCGKRQSQAMRNGFSGYSLKGNSYPLVSCDITLAYSLLSEQGVALIKETAPDAKIIFITAHKSVGGRIK